MRKQQPETTAVRRRICSNVERWFSKQVAKAVAEGWTLESSVKKVGFHWAVLTPPKN